VLPARKSRRWGLGWISDGSYALSREMSSAIASQPGITALTKDSQAASVNRRAFFYS
jgi:hypothetical protein